MTGNFAATFVDIYGNVTFIASNQMKLNITVKQVIITVPTPTVAPSTLTPTASPSKNLVDFFSGCNYTGYALGLSESTIVLPNTVIQSIKINAAVQVILEDTSGNTQIFTDSVSCLRNTGGRKSVEGVILYSAAIVVATYTPTGMPSVKPTSTPTTYKPSSSPSSVPSVTPTVVPSSPTIRPTILANYSNPVKRKAVMTHRFTFNDPPGIIARDSIGGARGILRGDRITLERGKAVFDWKEPGANGTLPYMYLTPGIIGIADTVTIEMWVTFLQYKPKAVLFSFGAEPYSIRLYSNFLKSASNQHIVVVFNPSRRYSKIYLNGALIQLNAVVMPLNVDLLGNTGKNESFNFIGRSYKYNVANAYNDPALACAIDEFRIYYGELSASKIQSNFIVGVEPSHVPLSGTMTRHNVSIFFTTASTQLVNISFFGGRTAHAKMFGAESIFTLTALDPLCRYSLTFPLVNTSSSAALKVLAMNYSVQLVSHPPAPVLDVSSVPNSREVYCDVSIDPYTYLSSMDQITKNLTITNVSLDSSFTYNASFTYVSGMCMSILGSKNFATSEPVPQMSGLTCYNKSSTILSLNEVTPLTINLFEIYPASNKWTRSTKYSDIVIDKLCNDSSVYISDLVSNNPVPTNITTTTEDDKTKPVSYTITPVRPRPSPPFDLTLDIIGSRVIGPIVSTYHATFYIPVTGSLPSEVPNVYPVSSDPNIIFLILRDPPGGTSVCTIAQGTTFETALSVTGLQASDQSLKLTVNGGGSVQQISSLALAPLGFGQIIGQINTKSTALTVMDTKIGVKSTGSTKVGYNYNMKFDASFSTGADPFYAGHPSDVIVGGGVDLFVTETLQVYVNRSSSALFLYKCLNVKTVYEWHPGHVTTFVLPVFEIESVVSKLNKIRSNEAQTKGHEQYVRKLDKQISNWKTILQSYQSANEDVTPLFTAENRRLNDMVNHYHQYTSLMLAGVTIVGVLESIIAIITNVFEIASIGNANPATVIGVVATGVLRIAVQILMAVLEGLVTTCSYIIPSSSSPILSDACNDFDSGKWEDMIHILNGACTMPTLGAAFLNKYCSTGSVDAQDLENGLVGDKGLSVYGFLNDPQKLLTFSAIAPMSLSWTSTVKSTRTFATDFTFTYQESFAGGFESDIFVVVVDSAGKIKGTIDTVKTITVGRTTDQIHESRRTVTITLGDGDPGDYFALRITEDPVYGTPVFTTLGGQSRCPGETGTSRRESNVRIVQVKPRCGADRNSPCTPQTLVPTRQARFGIIIENLSPTADEVYYTIMFVDRFESYLAQVGDCGSPGSRNYLTGAFQDTDLQRIPYNKWIEVPMTATPTWSSGFCAKFVDVGIRIIATCEQPATSRSVYQYGLKKSSKGDTVVGYEPQYRIYASNTTATFSVEWPPLPSTRRLGSVSKLVLDGTDVTDEVDMSERGSVTSVQKRELTQIIRKLTDEQLQELVELSDHHQKSLNEKIEHLDQKNEKLMFTVIATLVSMVIFLVGKEIYLGLKSVANQGGEKGDNGRVWA